MSLRIKLLAVMMPVMALCFVVLHVQGRTTMEAGFGRIELETGARQVEAIEDAVAAEQRSLLQLTRLQAVWDDPYGHLVDGEYEGFAEDYPPADMWNSYRIGVVAVVDTNGEIVAGGVTEGAGAGFGAMPSWVDPATIAGAPGDGICGFWGDEVLHLGCVHPVLHVDGSGPVAGWVAMFKPVDDDLLAILSDRLGVDLTIATGTVPTDVRVVDDELVTTAAIATASGTAFQLSTALPRTVMQEAERTRGQFERTILLVMGAFTAVLILVFERLVLRRISRVAVEIEAIRATSDTSRRLADHAGNDEIHRLARTTNDMLEVLATHEAAARTAHQEASDQLAQAERQLHEAASTEREARGAHDDALRLVSNAGREILGHLEIVATDSDVLASSVGDIDGLAADTARVTNEAVGAATAARDAVEAMRDSAATIERVAAFIASVAEETNLLALNATIEAARAGSVGAGFAVVADEVKQLARKTADSTVAITNDITSMRTRVEAIDHAVTDLATLNERVDRAASGIAESTARQRHATDEVRHNVEVAVAVVNRLVRPDHS